MLLFNMLAEGFMTTGPKQNQAFPPPGFVRTESIVEGIVVYRPAPQDVGPEKVVLDFKCPRCGGTRAYSVSDGGLRCDYCGHYEPPERELVGKGAREFEFKVETLERAAHGWGAERKELSCEGCGARISTPPAAMTVTCPFCGSNKVIQRPASQEVLRPRFLLPFQITEEDCQRVVETWSGSSWMVPRDLRRLAAGARFTPIFLPMWTFDALAQARWKAQVGHTKTERYLKDGEWKTRTRTVWRWESGRVARKFDDLVLPATAQMSHRLLKEVNGYDLGALVPYDPEYLVGSHAQGYDILLEDAWEQARHRMREETRLACRGQATTSRIRHFSMELEFADESWRYILVPAYVAAYVYRGESFQVAVNGQTGDVAGQRPVDWTKVGLAIAGVLAPGVLLTLVGVLTAILGIGGPIAALGMVLLVMGVAIAFVLLRAAHGMEDV
jgi:DNA-directed RNA polymerase subunit RPC12/RpoP